MLNPNNKKFKDFKNEYLNNKFFPHIVIDNFLNENISEKIKKEIIDSVKKTKPYFMYNVKKFALNKIDEFGEQTIKLLNYLNSQEFINKLEDLTGIKNIISDSRLEGGGLHVVKKDGYLNIHADFQSHIINKTWSRKINLLIYFNDGWTENNNGNLELWNSNLSEKVSYLPKFNRTVIFFTGKKSFHGHPHPLSPPENEVRKSIAIYYYVDMKKPLQLEETNFQALEGYGFFKKQFMKLDQILLRIFSYLKRRKIINDDSYTSLINFFTKDKKK